MQKSFLQSSFHQTNAYFEIEYADSSYDSGQVS